MRLILVGLAAAVLALPGATSADSPQPQRAPVAPKKSACKKPWQFDIVAKRALKYSARGGDFRAHIPSRHQLHRLAMMRSCVKHAHDHVAYRKMWRYWRHRRSRWRFYHSIDLITPYGKWAIPWYIVECESHGSWSAYNPSGAAGPYQIMASWGRPFPARTVAQMAVHHEIAARIWRGGAGASNWSCA